MNTQAVLEQPMLQGDGGTIFRAKLGAPTYDNIAPLRRQLADFLSLHNIPNAYADMFCLTVSEVLTNLISHPPQKADMVEIKLKLTAKHLSLDIADNSAVFADYDAKCKTALSRLNAAGSLMESGYGLGCILRQHAQVSYAPATASPDRLNHFRVRELLTGTAPQKTAVHKARIFLVDDDPVALRHHQAMLQDLYEVISFDTAEAAVKAFATQKPDLIVSDLNMPGMDGIGFRQALSVLEHGNATPFVFLSAQTASQDNPYISQLGVDDFLCKPVEKERLLNVASRLMVRALQVRQALEGKFQQHLTQTLSPSLPPRYGGWRLTTVTEAAEAGGGDFALWHEEPQHFLAVLADVMGHGPEAKFFSYAYAGYLRSIFRLQAKAADPAVFLKALSQSIEGDTFLESIILTCQSFQLFPGGGILIASAGHPAPLLISARDGANMVDIAGPLPGLISEPGYNLARLQLKVGDKLVFATDGFLQSFRHDTGSRPRLMKRLGALAANPGDEIAQQLWADFKAAPAGRNKDDATLIVAEYGGNA